MLRFAKSAVVLTIYLSSSSMCVEHRGLNNIIKLHYKYDKLDNVVIDAVSSSSHNTNNKTIFLYLCDYVVATLSFASTWIQPCLNCKAYLPDYTFKSENVSLKSMKGIIIKENHTQADFKATLQQFGAKGDGIADDTQAIIKALNSPVPLIYALKTPAYYKVSELIIVSGINKKKLIATGAKILNSDLKKATFLFQNSKNIEIEGGKFGYVTMPTSNGGNSQHVFQFDGCQNIMVSKVHIVNSPEMGIAITNSNRVSVKSCLIEHTFRDGTYSHYSANVKYINNIYRNIKDDAMSFHDYGVTSEKTRLIKFGYKQASHLLAQGNTIENAYQGFGSIGANGVQVIGNKFKNTVLSGIAIFNSKELYPNGTSLSRNAQIINNSVDRACNTVIISKVSYVNSGQASTGRAAIFVGSLGDNNQINAKASKRLKNILISGNNVTNSGAHGFLCNYTDNLKFTNNRFVNCSGSVPTQSLSGDIIELGNVTKFLGDNNTVIDNRRTVLHQHAYAFNNVSGQVGKWNVKGVLAGEKLLTATRSLRPLLSAQQKVKASIKKKRSVKKHE